MNTRHDPTPFPDATSVAAELKFAGEWDMGAVSALIRSKCESGATPSFLFLGRKEAALLREHLAEVFGADAVTTLHDTYYMGLEVVEIECDSFLITGGRKAVSTLQGPVSRRPASHDRQTDVLRQFRI